MQGVIAGLNRMLDLAFAEFRSEGGTLFVGGHGRIGDCADLAYYRDMVTIIRDRVEDMVKKGMTLDQVKAAKPSGTRIGAGRRSIGRPTFHGSCLQEPGSPAGEEESGDHPPARKKLKVTDNAEMQNAEQFCSACSASAFNSGGLAFADARPRLIIATSRRPQRAPAAARPRERANRYQRLLGFPGYR